MKNSYFFHTKFLSLDILARNTFISDTMSQPYVPGQTKNFERKISIFFIPISKRVLLGGGVTLSVPRRFDRVKALFSIQNRVLIVWVNYVRLGWNSGQAKFIRSMGSIIDQLRVCSI